VTVTRDAYRSIRAGLESGRIGLSRTPGRETEGDVGTLLPRARLHPPDAVASLGRDSTGRCLFFEAGGGNLCAIHRQVGIEALPAACRHFPRLCVLTSRGVSVCLSHYCPTVARALFRDDRELDIVPGSGAFPSDAVYEGLDARGALPPLLRPEILMCWESYASWERRAVATLARDDLTPEDAVRTLAAAAERARSWKPGGPPLVEWIRSLPDEAPAPPPGSRSDAGASLLTEVARCVPAPVRPETWAATVDLAAETPGVEGPVADGYNAWVRPVWGGFGRPVRRYLAAKAFASWQGYQGQGLRGMVFSLVGALVVLRSAAAGHCTRARRQLDEELLLESVRSADFLLVHLASREALTRVFDVAEHTHTASLLDPL
jgi:hypothetical protein